MSQCIISKHAKLLNEGAETDAVVSVEYKFGDPNRSSEFRGVLSGSDLQPLPTSFLISQSKPTIVELSGKYCKKTNFGATGNKTVKELQRFP